MTPIISPWFFYLLQITYGFIGILVFSIFGVIIYGAIKWYIIFTEEGPDSDIYIKESKKGKKLLICIIVLTIISNLIPTKTTCLEMLVAQNVTYERIEIVGQTVEDVYNDIISLFPQETEKSVSE